MDDTVDELVVQALLASHNDIFGQFFTEEGCISNVDPEVKKQAEEIFLTEYPDKNFEEFLNKWHNRSRSVNLEDENMIPKSQICSNLAFDPKKRRMVNVLAPRNKKSRDTEFDIFDFLLTRKESENCHPLRFQSDINLESDLEVLMEPQKHSVIDAGLRKIARALTVLNSSCSYRLLDVNSVRVIR